MFLIARIETTGPSPLDRQGAPVETGIWLYSRVLFSQPFLVSNHDHGKLEVFVVVVFASGEVGSHRGRREQSFLEDKEK